MQRKGSPPPPLHHPPSGTKTISVGAAAPLLISPALTTHLFHYIVIPVNCDFTIYRLAPSPQEMHISCGNAYKYLVQLHEQPLLGQPAQIWYPVPLSAPHPPSPTQSHHIQMGPQWDC